PRRDDDPVVLADVHEWMPLRGKTRQGGQGLALAARCQEQKLRRWHAVDVVERDRQAFGDLQEPELSRRFEVLLEAPPDHGNTALELHSHADEVLDPMDVRR